ncbi:MAG: DUF998 domain-containing protein [Vicinamibacterales bacterium]
MTIPFIYFGSQIVAAPFYPGYSFMARDASTLSSSGSSAPWIFNSAAIVIGVLCLVAAAGVWRAFRRLRMSQVLAALTSLALVSAGLGSLNAGMFPLPDPRHTGGLLSQLGMGVLLLPVLFAIAAWRLRSPRWLTRYALLNLLVLVAFVPVMSGMIQRFGISAGLDLNGYQRFLNGSQGLLQRVAALAVFMPIAVLAYRLDQGIRSVDHAGVRERQTGP